MQPKVKLRENKPIGRLINLLGVFDDARVEGEPLRSKIKAVADISEDDLKTIVAAVYAIQKALLKNNYEFARLAYQVLDSKLKTAIEPMLTPDVVAHSQDNQALWASSDNRHRITKSDLIDIANAIHAVRTGDKIGTPNDPDDMETAAVIEYGFS